MSWPVNVVLTEASMECYGRIFSFMLQLRRVAWTLKDCWYKLKRDGKFHSLNGFTKSTVKDDKFLGFALCTKCILDFQDLKNYFSCLQECLNIKLLIQLFWKKLVEVLCHFSN